VYVEHTFDQPGKLIGLVTVGGQPSGSETSLDAGGTRMTTQTDIVVNRKGKIPWYVYFIGAGIYTALAGWLFAESSPLAWVCLISAPVGFFYAWGAWKKEKHG